MKHSPYDKEIIRMQRAQIELFMLSTMIMIIRYLVPPSYEKTKAREYRAFHSCTFNLFIQKMADPILHHELSLACRPYLFDNNHNHTASSIWTPNLVKAKTPSHSSMSSKMECGSEIAPLEIFENSGSISHLLSSNHYIDLSCIELVKNNTFPTQNWSISGSIIES